MTIRVGIADDQSLVRAGFQVQLELAGDLRFVGEASTGEQAVELALRQGEVLLLVAQGISNAEIAGRLVVSPATVKTHVSRILTKLGLRDRAQLVIAAYESGLITPGG